MKIMLQYLVKNTFPLLNMLEMFFQLISWLCLHQHDGLGALQRAMQEYLVGSTYAATRRSLPASAAPLMGWLPFTLHLEFADVKVADRFWWRIRFECNKTILSKV